MPRAHSIHIPKQLGERAAKTLRSLRLLHQGLRIRINDGLAIPLLREPDSRELEILRDALGAVALSETDFQSRELRPRSLKEALAGALPGASLELLPKSLDIIGQVAILEIPPQLKSARPLIGKAVLEIHRNVKTVLAKSGPVKGRLRLREYEVIAGDMDTETTHREHRCAYLLDPTKVFFSPRLSTERMRVAQKAMPGETVLDMFAGVGPFSILTARTQPRAKVFAVELNPVAARYLTRNVSLNHVEGRVVPLHGDVREVVETGALPKADRVIMNLPENASEFVGTACKAIGKSGVIHYYTFKRGPDALREAEEEVSSAVKREGRAAAVVETPHRVRETAPREWQIAVDLRVF